MAEKKIVVEKKIVEVEEVPVRGPAPAPWAPIGKNDPEPRSQKVAAPAKAEKVVVVEKVEEPVVVEKRAELDPFIGQDPFIAPKPYVAPKKKA